MTNCYQFSCENVDLPGPLLLPQHQDGTGKKNLNVDGVVSYLYVVVLRVEVEVLDVGLKMGMAEIEFVAANVV